jgi:mannitol 2-dehydrogenase
MTRRNDESYIRSTSPTSTMASTRTVHALAPSYRKLYEHSTPSIVHLGVGNFFRSHLNFFTHCVLKEEEENTNAVDSKKSKRNWMIHGIGSTNFQEEHQLHQSLQDQSYLYSVLSLPSGQLDVVGSLSSLGHTRTSVSDFESALKAMSSTNTEIISMTVTEKGYHQDSSTGALNYRSPDIIHDMNKLSQTNVRDASSLYPIKTTVGLLVASLGLRKHLDVGGGKPITLLCCDNLPHNGDVLKSLVMEMSESLDPSLAKWIENSVAFPNSMVDRITPAADEKTYRRIKDALGIDCLAPVQAEDFYQWVVEDNFAGERPNWDIVNGVTFVDDVTKYENMKLRLLNGSHTALSYISSLTYQDQDMNVTVDKVMLDEDIVQFVSKYMNDVRPTLNGGPEGEAHLDEYCDSLLQRFSNKDISDQVSRLCQDGSKKFQGFVVPPLKEMLVNGQDVSMIQKVIASWYVYLSGEWKGNIDDPAGEELIQLAKRNELKQFVNVGIGDFVSDTFIIEIENEVNVLRKHGPREFLRSINVL